MEIQKLSQVEMLNQSVTQDEIIKEIESKKESDIIRFRTCCADCRASK
ncbi:MAG: hypothetical protein PHQ98_04330 [Candidatus ainarchaeum sp.]|nr:hypothetical protein [Candidatus ainarchaeum sp.]